MRGAISPKMRSWIEVFEMEYSLPKPDPLNTVFADNMLDFLLLEQDSESNSRVIK